MGSPLRMPAIRPCNSSSRTQASAPARAVLVLSGPKLNIEAVALGSPR